MSGLRQDILSLAADRRFAAAALAGARRFRPDVVYERSEYFTVAGLRIARALDVPLVLEVNGLLARDVRTLYRSPAEPVGRALERRKLARARAVVTVSPGLARLLEPLGADPARTVVVPNSIPDDRVRPSASRPDGLVIAWIGHLMPWHVDAVRLLLEVAPRVLAEAPRARFLVVGGGPGLDELRALAQRLGVAEAVEFTGFVPYAEVPDRLSAADVGVIPDVFDYAFPVKLVEYGAAGLAAVAPRSASLDDQVRPDVEYLPVPKGDAAALAAALVALARDPARVRELGGALQSAVRDRFTWSATGRALRDVVEHVLAEPG